MILDHHQPPMRAGLPLALAFRYWTPPSEFAKLEKLREKADRCPNDAIAKSQYNCCVFLCFSRLIANGRKGYLEFSVYSAPVTPASIRERASADMLEGILQASMDTAELWINIGGEQVLHLVGVEVAGFVPPWANESPWHANLTPLARRDAAPLQLSEDKFWFVLNDQELAFRGIIQANIIGLLIEARRAGIRRRTRELLAQAGSKADTLAKAFHKCPHWPKLKKIIRIKDGYCWIDIDQ